MAVVSDTAAFGTDGRYTVESRRPFRLVAIGFSVVAALIAGLLHQSGWLQRFDRLFYDLQIPLTGFEPSGEVVVVAIDEASLEAIGRWPWPRSVHANLIDRLSAHKPAAIGLDLILADYSQADGPSPDDLQLVEAARNYGRLVLPIFAESLTGQPILTEILPFPELASTVHAMGHVDLEVDPDGIVRTSFVYGGVGQPYWTSFALATLGTAKPGRVEELALSRDSPHQAKSAFSWQRATPMLIPFAGPPGSFETHSYADVLAGNVDPESFRDKIVLVGATAAGLGDIVTTPVTGASHPMSGIEVNANILQGLDQGIWRQQVARDRASIFVCILVLILFPLCQNRRFGWLAFIFGPLVLLALSALLFRQTGYWLPPSAALLTLLAAFPVWLFVARFRERQMRLQERERSHAILTSIDEGILVVDADDTVIYANPAISRLFDRQSAGCVGCSVGDLLPQTLREQASHRPAQLMAGDGRMRWITVKSSPWAGSRDLSAGSIMVVTDTTQTHEAERRLRASEARLRTLESQLQRAVQRDIMGQVSASIAHEVNQPLTALMTYANACKRLLPVFDEDGNVKLRTTLAKAIDQAERTGAVVKRVRALFESKELELRRVNLNDLVLEAISLTLIGRDTDDVVVKSALADHLPDIAVDSVQIQQVIVNLTRNALDAMENRSPKTIWVTTAIDAQGQVNVDIEDDGDGIAQDMASAMFDPFVSRKAGGMGIGLSISKAVMDAHHGDIELLPPGKHGARFRLTLPMVREEEVLDA